MINNLATGTRPSVLQRLLSVLGGRHGSSSYDGGNSASSTYLNSVVDELLSNKGQVLGQSLGTKLFEAYDDSSDVDRESFFNYLLENCGFDEKGIGLATAAYLKDPGPETLDRLTVLLEPRRQELLRRMNVASGGTERLLRMREDLIRFCAKSHVLRRVDDDFKHVFSSWFNQGFLELRQIDWDTPAAVLEKIIRYEAVHTINDWSDLRRRTDPEDRRLYAFFHPAIEDEPLIFVEVALTRKIPTAIAPILAEDRESIDPSTATTAVFYSISNCQTGLRGVSFGGFLIKQVVEALRAEYRNLDTFVTLSPIPGFKKWLKESANSSLRSLVENNRADIDLHLAQGNGDSRAGNEAPASVPPDKEVMSLVAYYLARAKRFDGSPADPVARFHLGNGARLLQLNWLADIGDSALSAANGIMVNYHYDLASIERNHEAFVNLGEVEAGPKVQKLLNAKTAALSIVSDPSTLLLSGR